MSSDSSSEWGFNGPLAGRTALVAGWGSTGHGSAPRGTHRLRSAIVPILSMTLIVCLIHDCQMVNS